MIKCGKIEGEDQCVLYTRDGSRSLGGYPYSEHGGKEGARAAAEKREGQVQMFKKLKKALEDSLEVFGTADVLEYVLKGAIGCPTCEEVVIEVAKEIVALSDDGGVDVEKKRVKRRRVTIEDEDDDNDEEVTETTKRKPFEKPAEEEKPPAEEEKKPAPFEGKPAGEEGEPPAEERPAEEGAAPEGKPAGDLPSGWTPEAVQKYWQKLGGSVEACTKNAPASVKDPQSFCTKLEAKVRGLGGGEGGGPPQQPPQPPMTKEWIEEIVEGLIGKVRGEGLGVDGPRQGDGGPDKCVCPKCGATAPHEKGKPCAEISCPKCGAAMKGAGEGKEPPPPMGKEQLGELIGDIVEKVWGRVGAPGKKKGGIATRGKGKVGWDDPRSWLKAGAPDEIRKKAWAGMGSTVTGCIARVKGKVDDPGAFCASLKDRITGTTKWRGPHKKKSFDDTLEEVLMILKEEGDMNPLQEIGELLEEVEKEEKEPGDDIPVGEIMLIKGDGTPWDFDEEDWLEKEEGEEVEKVVSFAHFLVDDNEMRTRRLLDGLADDIEEGRQEE